MKTTIAKKLTGATMLGVLAVAGAACEASDDGSTSPGQEAPVDGGFEDPATDPGTGTGDLNDPNADTGLEGDATTDGGA